MSSPSQLTSDGSWREYGPEIYDVHMAAMLDGELQTVSVYSIFHRTEPPAVDGDR